MSTLPVGSKFGTFTIVRHIGGGGMAQIYLAKTTGLAGFEKHLALKVINPDLADDQRFIQMLIDEAKLTVGLSHANIAQVFDLGKAGNIYYISMEFVDGIDVLELVNGLHAMGENVPVVAAAYITKQICSGLHYAHSRRDPSGQPLNIVHRDVSPQNILVSRAGEVKVVDFGIAKAAGMSAKTQAGVIKGKVHYMAPEQAFGEPADRRSDVFSASIVLWEMLTSRMVYSGENVKALVERVRKADIRPPSSVRPSVPAALDAIVTKGLARRKEERYQSAYELQVALTKFLSSSATDYGGSHLSELVQRVLSRRKAKPVVDHRLSKNDRVQDHHSVIAGPELGDDLGPPDRARLVVEAEQGRVVRELTDELLIGRAGQMTISDARVSRRHARLRRQDDGAYVIEDLGSSNGTYVNGIKLQGPAVLANNDVIRVGSCHIRYLAAQVEERSPRETLPVPGLPADSRLVIRCGAQVAEQVLRDEQTVAYEVAVGDIRLRGTLGRLSRRDDGVWLEPEATGRGSIVVEGQPARDPIRIAPGQSLHVGEFCIELVE